MQFFFTLFLIFAAASAFAPAEAAPLPKNMQRCSWNNESMESGDFTLQCRQGDRPFSLSITSPPGECVLDDSMRVRLQAQAGESLLNIPKAWYFPARHEGSGTPLCRIGQKWYPAYAVDQDTMVLFLMRDDRPLINAIGVALIDTKNMALKDYINLGNFYDETNWTDCHCKPLASEEIFVPYQTAKGYRILLERNHLAGDPPELAPDGGERHFFRWREITFENERIHTRWLRDAHWRDGKPE